MSTSERRKDLIRKLLKGIETGDPEATSVVNEARYIQHNPQTYEGSEGLAALFARLAKTHPRVNIVRAFEDGNFVFAHTEYDFSTRRIGFEVFRFDGEHAVEHWDNIQPRKGSNPSGHTMVDGPTESTELDRTEANRETVRSYTQNVLLNDAFDEAPKYIDEHIFIQHSPNLEDGIESLVSTLNQFAGGSPWIDYQKLHRVLAEGSFVLTVCEGFRDGTHTAFYDLYRLSDGKIIEHWDTVEAVAPRSEWKNDNGKF